MSLLYKIQTIVLKIIGDVQYFGWKSPFWFALKPPGYQLKGEHYRIVKELIQPGDILLQRYEGWIDKIFIKGWWNHAGIYVGGEKEQVIHAVSEGVLIEDIINFMRTDHLVVLRPPKEYLERAIRKAQSIVGEEYDFSFDFTSSRRFSCTEVVDYCYPKLVKRRKFFGRPTILPDDIYNTTALDVIWDSRKQSVKTSRLLSRRK